MASVIEQTELAAWIDKSIDYLANNWQAIPEIAAEWDTWDEYNRLDFVLEWPLREIRLRQLQRWRKDGLFTSAQLERFKHVEVLVERHRPTLERLLED